MTTSTKDIIELLSYRTNVPWYDIHSILYKLDNENLQDLKCIIEDVYEAGKSEGLATVERKYHCATDRLYDRAYNEGYKDGMDSGSIKNLHG